jgi:hypothetical protein
MAAVNDSGSYALAGIAKSTFAGRVHCIPPDSSIVCCTFFYQNFIKSCSCLYGSSQFTEARYFLRNLFLMAYYVTRTHKLLSQYISLSKFTNNY